MPVNLASLNGFWEAVAFRFPKNKMHASSELDLEGYERCVLNLNDRFTAGDQLGCSTHDTISFEISFLRQSYESLQRTQRVPSELEVFEELMRVSRTLVQALESQDAPIESLRQVYNSLSQALRYWSKSLPAGDLMWTYDSMTWALGYWGKCQFTKRSPMQARDSLVQALESLEKILLPRSLKYWSVLTRSTDLPRSRCSIPNDCVGFSEPERELEEAINRVLILRSRCKRYRERETYECCRLLKDDSINHVAEEKCRWLKKCEKELQKQLEGLENSLIESKKSEALWNVVAAARNSRTRVHQPNQA